MGVVEIDSDAILYLYIKGFCMSLSWIVSLHALTDYNRDMFVETVSCFSKCDILVRS